MKVTSVKEALALAKEVSTDDCLMGGNARKVRKLYRDLHDLTNEQMKGHHVHHLCYAGAKCLNTNHLVLMTHADHTRLHKQGNEISVEQRKKQSIAMSGANNPNYGKRGKDSYAYGLKRTVEQRKNISISKKGKKNPQYGKRGKDTPRYGKPNPHSAEQRKKTSLSCRITFAKKRGDFALAAELQIERDALEQL